MTTNEGTSAVAADRRAAPGNADSHHAYPSVLGTIGVVRAREALRAAIAPRDGRAAERERPCVDVHDTSYALCASGSRLDSYTDDDGAIVVFGHPTWKGKAAGRELAKDVLQAFRAKGRGALETLRGAFGLVLVDRRGDDLLLAIDRMGIESLAYAQVGHGVVFGSSAHAVANCAGATRIDAQSIFNYVFLHFVPGPATIFAGVHRLPPGGYLHWRKGALDAGRYWEAHYDEADTRDERSLADEFRALLERSVQRAIAQRSVGAFLSGGTDSSTIAGLATKLAGAPARTYSIGFDAKGYDEMAYARIAARHFGTDHHEYYVTPEDVRAVALRVAAACDQPFGNASAVPAYYCAALARSDGVDLMLGGDGGDELFGGNERYAMQAMLSWYDRVPAAIRRHAVEPLVFGLPGASRLAPLRLARGYVRQARMSVPERLHDYNMLRRNPPADVFDRDFLAAIAPDAPLAMLRATYDGAHARSQLNRMLALDLQFTLADNDLYKVSRMCELAGVDVAYPMLDDDVVAFSLGLPSRWKLRGTRLRYLFKQALRDFLPPEIIAKRKHGFGLPVGLWMASHAPLRDLAYDAVRGLAARGILRASFADRVIDEHRAGDAAYWGGEIWVLSQLEFWLAQHAYREGAAVT